MFPKYSWHGFNYLMKQKREKLGDVDLFRLILVKVSP